MTRDTGNRVVGWWLAAGLTVALGYYALSSGGPAQGVLFVLAGSALPVALAVGLRRQERGKRLPWALMLAGWLLNVPANVAWYLYPLATGRPPPYPSPADFLYISGYVLYLAGLVLLVRRRGRNDPGGLLEALVVTLGLGCLSWLFVIQPYFEASGLSVSQRLLPALAYPLIDVVLIGVAARLATMGGNRPPAFWFLSASIVAQTVADTMYSRSILDGSFRFGSSLFALWLVQYFLLGAAALHPSSMELSAPLSPRRQGMTTLRLVVLTTASLVPLTVSLIVALRGGATHVVALLAIAGGVFVLAVARMRILSVDISRFRRAEAAFYRSEQRYRSLVERLPTVTYVAEPGPAGAWTYVSPQIEHMLGYSPEEWLADPSLWSRRLHPGDRERVIAAELKLEREVERGASGPPILATEYRMMARDGREVWVRDEAFLASDGASPTLQGLLMDVTDRKLLEERLAHRAFHDVLTDLANRELFTDRAMHALAGIRRRGAPVTVLMVDLNGFKAVNDTLGHAAGDRLLAEFAARLWACVREMDTPARLGGDEFAVLIEDAGIPEGIRVAERIVERLKRPFTFEGTEVFIDVSIGIAEVGVPVSIDELMRRADAAMYAAKREGKGSYQIYRQELHAGMLHRLELAGELRRAIERKEFVLHYQPVVTLPKGEIVGLEALIRWIHPERGVVSPAEFIPLAEESGLVIPIDHWVIGEACRQARAWADRFPSQRLDMHVNISARQLHHADLVPEVETALRDSGLTPDTLTIEITEGVLMQDTEATLVALQRLKELGVRLAIDDFGIGFSSLSYLRRLPVDVVKIDRSFVIGIATVSEEWTLARGIIRLIHELGLEAVAEGIEEAEQAAHLLALGCRLGQGFYFARPAPVEEVARLLENAGRLPGRRLA